MTQYVIKLIKSSLSVSIKQNSCFRSGATFIQRRCRSYDIMSHNQKAYADGSSCPSLTPGVLRLYSMRYCPFAQRTRLVLEYKQIPYETVNINLKQKPFWFLKRNPLGLVPVLEKDGKVVYESLVCDDYLEEIYPERPLYPKDPYEKARERILIETFSGIVDKWYRVLRTGGTDEKVGKRFRKSLKMYEEALAGKGDYFGGSTPSMLDFTVWPWLERAGIFEYIAPSYVINKEDFPVLSAYIQRMFQRPEVKATMYDTAQHLHFVRSLHEGNPDYDFGLDTPGSRL